VASSAAPKNWNAPSASKIDVHNEDPKPFVWTRTADEILASIARFAQRTKGSSATILIYLTNQCDRRLARCTMRRSLSFTGGFASDGPLNLELCAPRTAHNAKNANEMTFTEIYIHGAPKGYSFFRAARVNLHEEPWAGVERKLDPKETDFYHDVFNFPIAPSLTSSNAHRRSANRKLG
jgi:hypothetical protein